jgi:hypothetical protein
MCGSAAPDTPHQTVDATWLCGGHPILRKYVDIARRMAGMAQADPFFSMTLFLFPRRRKRYFRKIVVEHSRADRAAFRNLTSIDEAARKRLLPKVRRTLNRVQRASSSFRLTTYLALLVVQLAISFAVMFPLLFWIFDANRFASVWPAVAGAIVCYGFIFLIPARTYLGHRQRSVNTALLACVYPGVIALFALANSDWQWHLPRTGWIAEIVAFLAGASIIGAFGVAITVGLLPLLLVSTRSLRRHTDALVLSRLVKLLADVEKYPALWDELPFKTDVIKELDGVANMMERDLPAQFAARDQDFLLWLRAKTKGIAAYIRDMRKWVSFPRNDTHAYFCRQMGSVVECLADGNWDGLPEIPPDQTPVSWVTRTFTISRGLGASLTPLALLAVLGLLKIKLPDAVAPYVYLGAILWAAVGTVALLDPLYASKFEIVKSAIQLLPTGKKKE